MAEVGEFVALAPNEGHGVWFLGTLITVKATGAETGGAYGLIEQVLPPGFNPPPHVHHAEDEAFYILAGRLTFSCGDATAEAGPGAFVLLPRGRPHSFRVEDNAPARLLQFNFPAGLERFFVEAGESARTPTLPPPAGPDEIERMLVAAPKYGIEILPPPA